MRRLRRYERMVELRSLGWSIERVAAEVGSSARTVERWLAAGAFPERKPRTGDKSLLDAYKEHLDRRWAEGCRRVAQLCREIWRQGYAGSSSTVYKYAAYLRAGLPPSYPEPEPSISPPQRAARPPSPGRLSWLLVRREEELSEPERRYLEVLQEACPDVATAYRLARDFAGMVRDREQGRLDGWLEGVSGAPPELRSFAEGVRRDKKAVEAALSEAWSSEYVAYCTSSPRSRPHPSSSRWLRPLSGGG